MRVIVPYRSDANRLTLSRFPVLYKQIPVPRSLFIQVIFSER